MHWKFLSVLGHCLWEKLIKSCLGGKEYKIPTEKVFFLNGQNTQSAIS